MTESKSGFGTLTRRSFLKTTAAAAGGAAAAGMFSAGLAPNEALAEDAKEEAAGGGEELFTTICRANCFQGCLLNAHVRDGKVVKMSVADYPEDIYTGTCLRGLSMHERTYSDSRIKYPMKRVEGTERGAGEWERIEWDQAISEIAEKIKAIQEEHGPKAMTYSTSVGTYGPVQGRAVQRLAYATGGTIPAGMYDFALGWGITRVMGGGTFGYSNEPKDMVDAKHIIIWGANPVWAQPQTWRILLEAKDRGAKLICVDIMNSQTSMYCDETIMVKPGTDLYIILAILNEIVAADAIDVEYAKSTTTAPFLIREDTGLFLRQSDIEGGELAELRDAATVNTVGNTKTDPAYVMDADTGKPALFTECKNPELEGEFEVEGIKVKTVYTALKEHMAQYTVADAAKLSGMTEEQIKHLIDIYTSGDPVTTYTQFGIDHYRGGHLWGQALAMVHGLTNNLSRHGTGLGGPGAPLGSLYPLGAKEMYTGPNPAMAEQVNSAIASCAWLEVAETGKFMGEDYPVKGYMGNSENPMSNRAEQARWITGPAANLDLIVMLEIEMTDTASYADYVLPTAFWLECEDIRGNFSNPYMAYGHKAIDPLWECKTDNEIVALLAEALGVDDVLPRRTDKEWIEAFLDTDEVRAMGITPESLSKEGAQRCYGTEEEPWIIGGYGAEFPTPSGRVELYCEIPTARYIYGQDWESEAAEQQFPIWLPPYESWPEAEIRKKYPLSYLQIHERGRTHTQWFTVGSILELEPEPLCHLAPADAEERGIKDMDVVEAYNDRGHAVCKAVIDARLPQGACYIPKGWQRSQFIEGGYQELTSNKCDFCAGGYAFYDAVCEVKKWEE